MSAVKHTANRNKKVAALNGTAHVFNVAPIGFLLARMMMTKKEKQH